MAAIRGDICIYDNNGNVVYRVTGQNGDCPATISLQGNIVTITVSSLYTIPFPVSEPTVNTQNITIDGNTENDICTITLPYAPTKIRYFGGDNGTFAADTQMIGDYTDLYVNQGESKTAQSGNYSSGGGFALQYYSAESEPEPEPTPTNPKSISLENLAEFKAKCDETYASKSEIPAEYTLPIASANTLGGVQPVAKTSEMTQQVGVDSSGALYTEPSPSVDSTPTQGSNNPVSSGGVYNSLAPIQSDISQSQTDITDLQDDVTALQNAVNTSYYTTQNITAAYTTRTTAAGAQIVNRGLAMLKTVQGKTVSSENLIPVPYYEGPSHTEYGVTFTVNTDGSITVNGTSTGSAQLILVEANTLWNQTGTFTISCAGSDNVSVQLVTGGGNSGLSFAPGTRTQTFSGNMNWGHILIQVPQGQTVSNVRVYPMLNEGSSALPYIPYFSGLKNAYFQSLKSTGANSETDEILLAAAEEIPEYNSIDFENGQNITGGRTLVFNGTEAWTQANGGFSYTLPETGVLSTAIVGLPYLAGTGELSSLQDGYVNNDATTLLVKDSTCATVAEFQQKLASLSSAGTPLEVRYQLATPTTSAISVSPYYRAWNGGTETVQYGSVDNSSYGAVNTLTQNYVEKGGIDL